MPEEPIPPATKGAATETPDRADLERRLRELMTLVRREHVGSLDSLVARVGHLQSRGAATRSTWYDWNDEPSTTGGLTVIAWMQMVGAQRAFEIIFGEGVVPAGEEASLLRDLLSQLRDVRARSEAQERRIERLEGRRRRQ